MDSVASIEELIKQHYQPIIISLFDSSGSWSEPYRKAGYRVIQIDKKLGFDIFKWNYKAIKEQVAGVLAAPPCTDFSGSGSQYWPEKDKDGRTAQSCKLVSKTLEIIAHFNHSEMFWAMENPIGRLRRMLSGEYWNGEPRIHVPDSLVDKVKEERLAFDPWDYGDPWTKRTMLWGEFNLPKRNPVPPKKHSTQGSWTQVLGGKSERTKELRSFTPPLFAQAFYEANNEQEKPIKNKQYKLF